MKYAPFALILGCSAMIGTLALQPEPLHITGSGTAPAHFGFSLPAIKMRVSSMLSFVGPHRPMKLTVADVLSLIHVSAAKHKVPAEFVSSIVAAESNFNSEALSPKGAVGLMQLMPATAKQYGANPGIPDQNVDAGTHYLRVLMDRYERYGDKSLPRVIAAYNAGPGNVDKYRGIPPFRETRGYVGRVLGFLRHFGGSSKKVVNG